MRISSLNFLSRLGLSSNEANDDKTASRESLRDDESGAMMVIGLFMAVFLVGMLYYIVGLGDAIAYRERMQDTSDVGSFTAAVVNARGMNLIVMLNMIMAAIMAILLSLKVIEVVVTIAMGIAAAIGALCFGCTAPAVAFLNTLRTAIGRVADAFEPIAKGIINVCHIAQVAIKFAWPVVGQGRAIYLMSGSRGVSDSPATAGLVFPLYAALPVENHIFRETCDRGAQLAVRLIASPFERIPIIGGRVASWIRSGARAIYDSFSAYFCGGPAAPDPPAYTVERSKPSSASSTACETQCNPVAGSCPASCDDVTSDACGTFLNNACHEATQEIAINGPAYCPPTQINRSATTHEGDAWCNVAVRRWQGCYDDDRGTTYPVHRGEQVPGDDTGALRQGARVLQTTIQPGCISRVQEATGSCRGSNDVMWSTEERYIMYFRTSLPGAAAAECTWNATAVHPNDLSNDLRNWSGHGADRASSVCGAGMAWQAGGAGTQAFAASCRHDPLPANWNSVLPTAGGILDGADPGHPICNNLPANFDAALADLGGNPYNYRREIRLVSNCIVEEALPIDVGFGGETAAESGDWKPPQRVCELTGRGAFFSTGCATDGDPIFHGAEEFQIRGAAVGREQSSNADQGTRVATWSGEGQRGMGGVTIPDPSAHIGIWDAAHVVGRFSLSQAEFFWDQDENCNGGDGSHCEGFYNEHGDEREWMWDMAWTSRMRRIHFSDPGTAASSVSDSSDSGGIGSGISGWFDAVFIH
ncbi:MAG: hypothetical protein ACI9KE_003619 [Polyangiales bacterium]|jgi:hypothetical protein